MSTITRTQAAKQLVPGLNEIFGLSYKSVTGEYKPLFDIETSNRAFEEEVLMTQFGTAPEKTEGAAVEYDTAQEGYTSRYEHKTIALAFGITEEAMEDNLYDTWSKIRANALGRAMANTKEVFGANVYNNGFSTSYPGGDGQPLFSASHPTMAAGTQSNLAAVDISETALENAKTNIWLLKDDRGILVGAMPRSLHIPPQLEFVTKRILGSDGRVGTADNDLNALKALGYFSGGGVINRRFTDPGAWFIRTDVPNGLKHFVRVRPSTAMQGDFDTGNMRYKSRERYSFGWSDWRAAYGST